jgi:hypothetical protein
LFGTKNIPWTPFLPDLAAGLQVAVLLVGLAYSISVTFRIGRQHAKSDALAWWGTLPVAAFLSVVTLAFLKLYVG